VEPRRKWQRPEGAAAATPRKGLGGLFADGAWIIYEFWWRAATQAKSPAVGRGVENRPVAGLSNPAEALPSGAEVARLDFGVGRAEAWLSQVKGGYMARIKTVSPEAARGIRRLVVWWAKRQYGFVPGILQVGLVDLSVGRHLGAVYDRLHLRKSSPLSRLQREMLAVVVNGHVNGAP
jgi:hypothetical protein